MSSQSRARETPSSDEMSSIYCGHAVCTRRSSLHCCCSDVCIVWICTCRACVSAKEYVDPLAIILCKELTVLSNADMPKTALKQTNNCQMEQQQPYARLATAFSYTYRLRATLPSAHPVCGFAQFAHIPYSVDFIQPLVVTHFRFGNSQPQFQWCRHFVRAYWLEVELRMRTPEFEL